ncbi:hypothetical protein B0H16DRAFT_1606885 [Mycena metata]|uniref:Uncharacterized protein n=1 Tax=Mycena metata TaxID=1033252 RepID=A0AAD7HF68_9AGAR|nr:hypothetical protein B0H16DRAFT_1606885 [Mycena metata]
MTIGKQLLLSRTTTFLLILFFLLLLNSIQFVFLRLCFAGLQHVVVVEETLSSPISQTQEHLDRHRREAVSSKVQEVAAHKESTFNSSRCSRNTKVIQRHPRQNRIDGFVIVPPSFLPEIRGQRNVKEICDVYRNL